MKIEILSKSVKSDGLIVFVPEEVSDRVGFSKILPKELAENIKIRLENGDFKGKEKECLQIFSRKFAKTKIFLIGLGKTKSLTDLQKCAGLAIRKCQKQKCKEITVFSPDNFCIKNLLKGLILGSYQFKIGDQKNLFKIEKLGITTNKKIAKKDLNSTISLSESINMTRDLVNKPTNFMTPEILADFCKNLGKGLLNPLKVKILEKKEIEKLKMGGILGVSAGSKSHPRVIIFEYNGGKKSESPIALVGKGVCFDSGGYNLKPSGHIEDMKMDMAGAGTVVGIFNWIKQNKPKKNIIGIIGAVENMVSDSSYRPGDIITMMNGQTCKITNTDAEGRLVLADCLNFVVEKYKPSKILDFATLTGACIAALGYHITGIMGNNENLIKEIKVSSKSVDEKVWELPLNDFFREKIKETECDLQNWTAGVSAGSSMAGAFLENFVQKTPWCHFDIAGSAFAEKSGNELHPKGGTGIMISTICEMIK